MQKKIKIITAKIGDAKPVTCYYMIAFGEQGNWSAGRGSFIHELMELAGGYNIARDIPSPWGIFDLEMLLQKDPEVIFMGKTAGNLDSLSRLPLYKDLRAVKQGRVMVVDDDLVSRPGPRIVEGLALMAKTLHPERFP
jgi:iron complex transport system substrate-binding protein